MTWLSRRVPRDAAPPDTTTSEIGPTTFTGVSTDVGRGILEDGTGLYEFWTDAGDHVYLHDMDFQWLLYNATPTPELSIHFDWSGQPVPDTFAGPFVEVTFGDVRIRSWHEEPIEEVDRAHLGQVGAFNCEKGLFSFQTYGLSLVFAATTCHVASSRNEAHD